MVYFIAKQNETTTNEGLKRPLSSALVPLPTAALSTPTRPCWWEILSVFNLILLVGAMSVGYTFGWLLLGAATARVCCLAFTLQGMRHDHKHIQVGGEKAAEGPCPWIAQLAKFCYIR